jgi:rare lipoprotein A
MSRALHSSRLGLVLSATGLLAACASAPAPRMAPLSSPPARRAHAAYNRSYVVHGRRYRVLPACAGYEQRGIASWYGPGFNGHRTSTGEVYNMYGLTAASKVLPLPCWVRVTNLRNGRQVVVKVNDRGPFVANRIIDLSYAAARRLHMVGTGTAIVELQAIDPGRSAANPPPPRAETRGAPSPRLFLQVGAFASQAHAAHLATALKDLGFGPVMVDPLLRAGKRTLYTVRLGPLADVGALDAATQKMSAVGIHGFRVRVE